MNILPVEQNVGLDTFYSKQSGIGGKIRTIPEDFIVIEQFQKPVEVKDGPFTIATVTAKNWETNTLIRSLAKQLQTSRKRIHFAGTKDKRSISTQLLSFYRIGPEHISHIHLKDVEITDIYQSSKKLHLGDLIGNYFNIAIRDISNDISKEIVSQAISPFSDIQGFPNFFGIQRFGIVRPITHLIGRHIIDGNFQQAVMDYLVFLDKNEDEESYLARKQLKETNDYTNAFHTFPRHLIYEKSMLNILQKHPDDYIAALKELPSNLITLFVYAYQSFLFNKILSIRIKQNLPIHTAIEGDKVIYIKNGRPTDEIFLVNQYNIEKVNKQIERKKAVVSTLLVGVDSEFSDGEMGEIERKVIEDEQIDKRDFIIPELTLASSFGSRRSIFAPLTDLKFTIDDDVYHKQKKVVNIEFQLRKGSYATSFLREIMKSEDIKHY